MIRETLGLGDGTWFSIGVNAACFSANAYLFNELGNPISAACAGFHVGLIFMCIVTDRVFLAPTRADIRRIEAYLKREEK